MIICRMKFVNTSQKTVELMHFSNVLITVVSMATKLQPEFAVPYCQRYESRSILGWAMHFIFVHLHVQNSRVQF